MIGFEEEGPSRPSPVARSQKKKKARLNKVF